MVKLKKFNEAFSDINKAIQLNPYYSTLYINKGNFNFMLKHFKKALIDYSKAIKLNPTFDIAYTYKGDTQYRLKDFNGAIDSYSNAVKYKPGKAKNYFRRGMMNLILQWMCVQLRKIGKKTIIIASDMKIMLHMMGWLKNGGGFVG